MSDLFSGLTSSIKNTANAITKNEYVRKIAETVSDSIMNYSEAELAVREATNEDPWGPTGPQMKKIAEFTKSRRMEDFYNVHTPLFVRMLVDNKDSWRRVYKSLVLFDYLLKNGSERFVNESKDKIYEIRRLESYKYIDEKGRDQGINIRHRAKLILDMMGDDEKLREERNKAISDDKSKYRGYDQYDMRSSSSGFGSSSGSSSWKNSATSDFSSNLGKKETREVSNFSFEAENRSPSPELGFADVPAKKTVAEDEDDGFGDFVSSRSSQPYEKKVNTAKALRTTSGDFFAAQLTPPPPSGNVASLPRKPSLTNEPSNIDLLGGFSTSTISSTPLPPSSNFDILSGSLAPGNITTPAPVETKREENLDLFGIGNTVKLSQQNSSSTQSSNTLSGLNDLTFGFSSQPQDLFQTTNQSQKNPSKPHSAPKIGNSFAGLDQFMTLSLSSSSTNQPKAKTLNEMMDKK